MKCNCNNKKSRAAKYSYTTLTAVFQPYPHLHILVTKAKQTVWANVCFLHCYYTGVGVSVGWCVGVSGCQGVGVARRLCTAGRGSAVNKDHDRRSRTHHAASRGVHVLRHCPSTADRTPLALLPPMLLMPIDRGPSTAIAQQP